MVNSRFLILHTPITIVEKNFACFTFLIKYLDMSLSIFWLEAC